MEHIIRGYIYNVNSYETFANTGDEEDESVNFADIFYIPINDELANFTDEVKKNEYIANNLSCIRLFNFYSSFYIHRLPNMSIGDFQSFVSNTLSSLSRSLIIRYKYTYKGKPLTDASYFNFNNDDFYAKIKSKSSRVLSKAFTLLKNACIPYYAKFKNIYETKPETIPLWDKLFYENSESPFRFNMTTLHASNIKYYLSTKYNIPCVGGFEFKFNDKEFKTFDDYNGDAPGYKFMSLLKNSPNNEYKTLIFNMNGQNSIFHNIVHNERIAGQQYLTLMSYDIETYDTSVRKLEDNEKYIMCIGVGFFNITNDKPFLRYCLSIKDITEEDKQRMKIVNTTNIYSKDNKIIGVSYLVENEYSNDPLDMTNYIFYKDEQTMLIMFMKLIDKHRPTFITGFNNYGFDDDRINSRLTYYGKADLMTNILRYYNVDVTICKDLKVDFKEINIKIDGQNQNGNKTWTGNSKVFFTDTYKIILASNPKLYTQQGRGNLDTMLTVNKIKNPFNGQNLSKSGLTYDQMWYNWDNNIDIYDIYLYCTQDAWITGTLLIKSCQLIDKIEMSTLSATTITDSIFKAVTWRVKHIIEKYAWENSFAVADNILKVIDKNTNKIVSRTDCHILGNKQFDTRTIVGGEVKNIEFGRQTYIIALDFSAMYPSQKEGSNIDTSSMVPKEIIENPTKYGLNEYHEPIRITDMYKDRDIHYLENEKGEKFVVERFMSEFKNKKDDICKVLEEMELDRDSENKCRNKTALTEELKKLAPTKYSKYIDDVYYNGRQALDIVNNIPATETKYLYAVQSPRDENNLVTTHYSLKEIMLSDLRSLRNSVKKQMAEATNSLDKNRYNAKQNAIKIMCNSEYGASNSEYFPYYDTLIGGATTAASRCLINFLTQVIQTNKLYVNSRFINDNKKYLDKLAKYCVLEYHKLPYVEDINEFMLENRRFALREMYDEFYNIICTDIYVIEIERSNVVYQDTDSNYYSNKYIKSILSEEDSNRIHNLDQYYKDYCEEMGDLSAYDNFEEFQRAFYNRGSEYETPFIINLKMNLLLNHNNLIGNFIKDAVYRKPVSVGFEGAFIVVRYFNVKKKYYGIVWNDKMKYKMPDQCYDENGNLVVDYNEYWTPAKTTYPMNNGDYVMVDENILLHTDMDKLAYIKGQNVKLTGVDLARRDQYKFININHIRLIQQDLRFLKYVGNNNWENILNMNMLDIIKPLLMKFKNQFITIQTYIDNMYNDVKCDYDCSEFYNLLDYAKDVSFKYDKCNFLVCVTRVKQVTKTKTEQCRWPITDTNLSSKNTGYLISYVDAYDTNNGTVRFILERNKQGNYTSMAFDDDRSKYVDISDGYKELFEICKYNDETAFDEFYIDYDCIAWQKKNNIMQDIGNRLYKNTIGAIKDQYKRRITDQEFIDNFPSSFGRKQYVIMLTKEVIQERLKGIKSESVTNSEKAFLIDDLHERYKAFMPEEKYKSFKYHDCIKYEDFIDLLIINDLDHIHYMEAFCSAISLYLIEYAAQICNDESLRNVKRGDDEESEAKNKTISDIKKSITWNLLIQIYPERVCKKPKNIKKVKTDKNDNFQPTKLTQEKYKELLLVSGDAAIRRINKELDKDNKIFIISETIEQTLKPFADIYNNSPDWKRILLLFYNNKCKTELNEVSFKLICERCNIIMNALYNQLDVYINDMRTFDYLEFCKENNLNNVEIYKTVPRERVKYFKRLFDDNDESKIIDAKSSISNKISNFNEFIGYFHELRKAIIKLLNN